jgi:hypothetical protein
MLNETGCARQKAVPAHPSMEREEVKTPARKVDLAILFWFYADVELCVNRTRLLRQYNPDLRIYGLFGGAAEDRVSFEQALAPWLDDFWAYPDERDPQWKWRNGDLVVAEWFAQRGAGLTWETVALIQWDMLVLAPLSDLFAGLEQDQLLLSGLRPIGEVNRWWYWVRGKRRREYRRFLKHVRTSYGYEGTPMCCLFVVACLPRSFLERYAYVEERELGFLEYRIPIYGHIFGIDFSDANRFHTWWASDPTTRNAPERERLINAGMYEISREAVLGELRQRDGTRLFHPFREVFPVEVAPPPPDGVG